MKRVSIIITFLAGIFMIWSGCASRAGNVDTLPANAVTSGSMSSASNTRNTNAGLQEIDEGLVETDPAESEDSEDEGQKEAEKFWAKYAPTCNGTTYMKSGKQSFIEFNGFRINMEYAPITQADQLNGIEAKGLARIVADTHRSFYDSKWHEWSDGASSSNIGMVAHFKRYKGQWQFEGGAYFNNFTKAMDCSEVPDSTSAENPPLRFDGL